MIGETTQNVFAQLSGQDDNLGDSALRIAFLEALRGSGRHVHVYMSAQTTDYLAAFRVAPDVTFYDRWSPWVRRQRMSTRPVLALNAGEINPPPGVFPAPVRVTECERTISSGGVVLGAGIGIKSVEDSGSVTFAPIMRDFAIMSWRDQGSRDAAGFGEFAPDWAYSLGTPISQWVESADRGLIAVTMRFDRPFPGEEWIAAVRAFAMQMDTRIVTLAQVGRDAPRAVRLAELLGGDYLVPPSMSHDQLDDHVRDVYRRSLAVISDRAHGLIIGATEGAFPIGSASDPQKVARLLAAVGLGGLVGRYDELPEFAARFEAHLPSLGPAVDGARADIADLTKRIRDAMEAVA